MINLITSFFRPENTKRLNELMTCLKNNIDSKYIKKIYLFMESKEDIKFLKQEIKITRNKIQLILWNKQPFYSDYLNLANQLKGEICMISNADIWLKSCDTDLINLLLTKDNIGYALTRHDRDSSGNFKLYKFGDSTLSNKKPIGSFDSFIFKSPIFVDYKLIGHIQNRPGSEHIFKTELEEYGIKFYNPSESIIIIHEHLSNYRTYTSDDDLLWKLDSERPGFSVSIYKKQLTSTPPMTKQQILNIINIPQQSEKIFKSTSVLFGRH